MKSQKRDAQLAADDFAKSLTPDAERIALEKSISAVMLEVFNQRVEHGVSIAFATPAKLSSGGNVSKLDTLTEDVPGTTVKSVRVNVSGTYATYLGLLGYLKALQGLPVAIVRMKVHEQSFELSLRVYGNE